MKWCIWRWTFTPSGYITRLHLVKTPLGALMVHFINGPDPEPHLHDHPVTFLSFIVRGWYAEMRQKPGWYEPRFEIRTIFNWIRAIKNDRHKIIMVADKTVTFCLVGHKTREWGFHTPEGWVHWKDYNEKYYRG
jgi:hypothetical protein